MSAEPVRFGILSTANIGGRLVTAFAASPRAELVAVASRTRAAAEAYAAKHGLGAEVRLHDSYQALLDDDRVEAIYNPLPNSLHAEWTIRAAEAGKHILCEKPLAVDVAECRAMIAAAERAGVVFQEAFMYRYHPATQRLWELVREGAIGEVRLVRSSFCFTIADPANIRLRADVAGGATMDVGCYCITLARDVTGEEPASAYAAATFGAESGVDETLCGTLAFPSGAVGQFVCSVKSGGHQGALVLGSTGSIEIARPWFPDAERAVLLVNGEEHVIEYGGELYQHQVEAMCAAIRDAAPLPLPPIDGARTMAALCACLRSARAGTVAPVEVV